MDTAHAHSDFRQADILRQLVFFRQNGRKEIDALPIAVVGRRSLPYDILYGHFFRFCFTFGIRFLRRVFSFYWRSLLMFRPIYDIRISRGIRFLSVRRQCPRRQVVLHIFRAVYGHDKGAGFYP